MSFSSKENLGKEHYEDDDDADAPEIKTCSNSCCHFDELNQCCWLATETSLATDVCEGDQCIHGLKEDY